MSFGLKLCEVSAFCYFRRHRKILADGVGAGRRRTGGVARLDQADDGATI